MICGVACPQCDSRRSTVVDSRASGHTVRRRRKCSGCGARFTTYEVFFDEVPEGALEQFDFVPRKGMVPHVAD